jgi:hypothetical protein
VAARLERLDGDRMDVLEEEDLHPSRVGAVNGRSETAAPRWDGSPSPASMPGSDPPPDVDGIRKPLTFEYRRY